ncbi:hypothetical protein B7P43_G18142 [Cryptotermes secundus]|uniref:BESS domain-containing protein n=1 Tax=Cryptotermes secundus TaxID=105785 RepID=A0A2J7PB95_9NEOP|nr:uncharacterized protein LOC111875110 [Cryptotermes secundus]PNF13591.1 hypothetical protein B7P43_G18142 [Cryptotermes secundus]
MYNGAISVEDIKKRWRGLRDTFRKELKKCRDKRYGSGGDTSHEPKWAFFNQLWFLTDTVEPRSMTSSVPDVLEDSNEMDTENNDFQSDSTEALSSPHQLDLENAAGPAQENDEGQQVNIPTAKNKTFKSPQKKKGKKRRVDYDDKLLEIETKKLSYFEQSSKTKQDSDYQFLTSLLPTLQAIPNERKLHVRMSLMNVILQEQELSRSAMTTPNASPLSSESSFSSQNNQVSTLDDNAAVYYTHFIPSNCK